MQDFCTLGGGELKGGVGCPARPLWPARPLISWKGNPAVWNGDVMSMLTPGSLRAQYKRRGLMDPGTPVSVLCHV